MNFRITRKKSSTLVAARTALRAVRDSSQAFPPLQSAAAALMIVWDMSEVSFLFAIPENHSVRDIRKQSRTRMIASGSQVEPRRLSVTFGGRPRTMGLNYPWKFKRALRRQKSQSFERLLRT
jgi:hypothetical protein